MGHTTPDAERHQVSGDLGRLGPQLERGAPDLDASGAGQAPAAPLVGRPGPDIEVEGTVHLEQHGRAVGQVPLAVGPSPGAAMVATQALTVRHRHRVPPAHPDDVELGSGVGPAVDVVQHRSEEAGAAQWTELVDHVQQAGGRGQALLDGRRDDAHAGSDVALVGRPQQHGRLEPGRRDPIRPRAAQGGEATAAAEEPHARHGVDAERFVDPDRDRLAAPPAQAQHLGCGEAAQDRARTGVEDGYPPSLLDGEGPGAQAHDPRGAHGPPARAHLVAHPIGVDPVIEQLTPGQHPGLHRRQPCQEVVVHAATVQHCSDPRTQSSTAAPVVCPRTRHTASSGTRPVQHEPPTSVGG